jgi:glycolate oxidase iron-sulfur subunit
VQYGRLIEAARAHIENAVERPWHVRTLRQFVFGNLLPSRAALKTLGVALYAYRVSGLQTLVRSSGILKLMGKLGRIEQLAPSAEMPPFYGYYGKVLPPRGERRYRVAFLGGCMANIFFARLNEATVRVLRRNGCEVSIPEGQTCCGALHVHSGLRDDARALARRNIDALAGGGYDAIITNAAGCGSTLKEYDELLDHDPGYVEKARLFKSLVKDVTEFLAGIELSPGMRELPVRVTYQDSCHLAHGQKIKAAPRVLLRSIPGLQFIEMPYSDLCCGSAGVYNVVHDELAASILEKKMTYANSVQPDVIATANPGCMLQLDAGVRRFGKGGQQVKHVVELLDEAYGGSRGL